MMTTATAWMAEMSLAQRHAQPRERALHARVMAA